MERFEVPVEQLRKICKVDQELTFCASSCEVPAIDGVIGQDRAVRALSFGLGMDAPGYHIFVSGQPGTGKTTYVQASVEQAAATAAAPSDWCYVHNFSDTDCPLAIGLLAGQGRVFQRDMAQLVADLLDSVPKAFENSDFEQQKDNLVESFQKTMQEKLQAMQQEATAASYLFKPTPGKFIMLPLLNDKPLSQEDFLKLPAEEREAIERAGHQLENKLEAILHEGRILERQTEDQIAELEKQITMGVAHPALTKMKEKYSVNAKLLAYLEAVEKDIEENHERFLSSDEDEEPDTEKPSKPAVHSLADGGAGTISLGSALASLASDQDELDVYKVNVLVSHEKAAGAPVVMESYPHFYNLFGKIEYRSQLFSADSDFTMIKAGALHRANGGYLILQAKDVLTEPLVWEQLKRALKYQQAVIENIGEQYRYTPTVAMRPEPIPLKVKVILIGIPLYYLYLTQDEDFTKLFKVRVDFDTEMARTQENIYKYVAFVSSLCRKDQSIHLNRAALGQIVEYGSRLAGHQDKLSTQFNEVGEIVYEAIALAKTEQAETVDARHVDLAIRERRYRANRLEEKIQEQILHGKILISTSGVAIGQVNGLSVIESGAYWFGQPSRITAVTFMGRSGVVNIERETEMSGQIHSKGVLTLAGFLGQRFAQDKPLSLTAQVTFEQNYEGVDGDSASSSELYAILSSLADLPLRQSLAVTGSVNQHGEIQPIGGATEKIEGFFDICKAKGLSGEQGVLIPAGNTDHLMLKDDVLDAVKAGQFHIYAVRTIEEGIELLSGMAAGSRNPDDRYPEDTVFGRVDKKLQAYHQTQIAALKGERI